MPTTPFITDRPILFGRTAVEVTELQHVSDLLTTTMRPYGPILPVVETSTNNLDMEILSQQQDAASGSSLYSIEELSHLWYSTDCTALIHGLLASFSVILVSELGDKTFIITAIMAMKNSRSLVFLSSALALFLMTVLSVGMGVAVTVVPKLYTHYASIVLFLCFGLKMLHEAYDMDENEGGESEFSEVERSLGDDDGQKEIAIKKKNNKGPEIDREGVDKIELMKQEQQGATEDTQPSPSRFSKLISALYIAPIVIKVFTMVFVAEWGDRSQISTVILAAREDVVGVFVGSLTGHVLCTGLAVIGGRFVADIISVRTMTLLGGIIFLFFATFAILTGPEQT